MHILGIMTLASDGDIVIYLKQCCGVCFLEIDDMATQNLCMRNLCYDPKALHSRVFEMRGMWLLPFMRSSLIYALQRDKRGGQIGTFCMLPPIADAARGYKQAELSGLHRCVVQYVCLALVGVCASRMASVIDMANMLIRLGGILVRISTAVIHFRTRHCFITSYLVPRLFEKSVPRDSTCSAAPWLNHESEHSDCGAACG